MKNKISLQFIQYCLCGGMGVISDLSSFYVLLSLGVNYQISNFIGYGVGTILSFFLNRKITFQVADKAKTRFTLFLGVALIGYLSSAAILEFLVSVIFLDPRFSKIITLPIIVALQYTLNKKITFKSQL